MEIKKVKLRELQPTHIPRTSSFSFMDKKSLEELKALGLPQVWETRDSMLLISDGNNRCRTYAKRGLDEVEVQFYRENSEFGFLLAFDEIKEQARTLRSRGIFSPYDLWRARDGIVIPEPVIDVYSP